MKKFFDKAITVLIDALAWAHEFAAKAVMSPVYAFSDKEKASNGTDIGTGFGLLLYILVIVGKCVGSTGAVFVFAGVLLKAFWIFFLAATVLCIVFMSMLVCSKRA